MSHLTVRKDSSVVSLEDRLHQRRPADFINPLLRGAIAEHCVEEEALGGFACVSAGVTDDDFSPVFLRLGDPVNTSEASFSFAAPSKHRHEFLIYDSATEKSIAIVIVTQRSELDLYDGAKNDYDFLPYATSPKK